MSDKRSSYNRIVAAAEDAFREHGYDSVTLQNIAGKLGIKKPSLYYHFPGGKEELYLASYKQIFDLHAEGLRGATANAENLEDRLIAAADWFLSNPPMFLMGMFHADLECLSETGRASIFEWSYRSVIRPVVDLFLLESAGGSTPADPHIAASLFLASIESSVQGERLGFAGTSAREMALQAIRIIVRGWTAL